MKLTPEELKYLYKVLELTSDNVEEQNDFSLANHKKLEQKIADEIYKRYS